MAEYKTDDCGKISRTTIWAHTVEEDGEYTSYIYATVLDKQGVQQPQNKIQLPDKVLTAKSKKAADTNHEKIKKVGEEFVKKNPYYTYFQRKLKRQQAAEEKRRARRD